MSVTCVDMCRELSLRMDDLVLAGADSGTTTTLVDTDLNDFWPNDVAQFNAWVYGSVTSTAVVASNQGVEKRAQSWAATGSTITFHSAWPAAITSAGTYEIRRYHRRERVLAAINAGLAQLSLWAYRYFKDESLTTATGQYTYTLPSSQNWSSVLDVEIQVNTSSNLVGYPYGDAMQWNWAAKQTTDASGTKLWYLQFTSQPPPNRTLRVWGLAYMPKLSAEGDIVALSQADELAVTEWVYNYAMYCLHMWQANVMEAGQVDEYRRQGQALLDEAEVLRLRLSKSPPAGRIIIPTAGRGTFQPDVSRDIRYFGAFGSTH